MMQIVAAFYFTFGLLFLLREKILGPRYPAVPSYGIACLLWSAVFLYIAYVKGEFQ